MEDDARPLAGEHLVDQRGVLDVAHDRRQRQLRKPVGKRRLDRIDRGLGQVEEHELRRAETGDVPAQLGADRAARAGDHDHAVAEPLAEPRAVEHHRIAPQQVVELDRADRGQRRAAADQVLVRGTVSTSRPASAQISATRRRTPCAAEGSATITCRTPYFLAHAGRLEIGPSTLTSSSSRPLFRRVVVDQPDDAPLPAPRELARQARAGLAGADDQHRLAQRRERAVEPVLLPDPVGEAIAGHQEDEHDRVEDQHAARHDRLQPQHHQHQRNQQRAQAGGEDDPLQVEDARESPQAAIEAERDEDRGLQRQDPRPACAPCRRETARGNPGRNGASTSPPRRARPRRGRGQNASQARKL